MIPIESTLARICQKIEEREQFGALTFQEFMELSAEQPNRVFRNIFQIFYDMVYSHVGEGVDEYPDDPESINYVYYDCSSLFVEGADHPFFADRLFANRFISHIGSFKRGAQQNRIYIFEGPHGSGKSTFLNNLLLKFEQYTRSDEGACYEVVWRLNRKELGAVPDHDAHNILQQLRGLADSGQEGSSRDKLLSLANKEYLEVPCPSHDHPLLLIPKTYRRDLLDGLIKDEQFKRKLFFKKPYEWVVRDQPCTICMSLYQTLLDLFRSPSKVFEMVYARRYHFNRRLGEGISVFNPGDSVTRNKVVSNQLLQQQFPQVLRTGI
jgi:predicted Ser/Thr protein kinase